MSKQLSVVDTTAEFGAGGIIDAMRAAWRDLGNRMRERADYRELMSMDDRMLDDIGLSRGDIASVLRGDPTRRMR